MKVLFIITLLISGFAFAESQAKFKDLMHGYLLSIKTSNETELKKKVSAKYFNSLKKDDQLKELFSMQKNDGKKIDFDLKFQKFGQGNEYLVNVKDKSKKEYDHFWYVVKKVDGKFVIDREFHMD